MARHLKIVWEGDVPGLSEHRLSLSAFGEPLMNLLAAYKRIASDLMSDALEGSEFSRAGRLANVAKRLDIEIISLEEGSTGISALFTFQPAHNMPEPVLESLADAAGQTLLLALEQESRGNFRHAGIRKYLRSLPSEVRRQKYALLNGNDREMTVEIGELHLPEVPREIPYLVQFIGNIIGVGFEPGKNEIRLKSEIGQVTLIATPEQVEQALQLRDTTVQAFGVMGKPARLLKIQAENAPVFDVNAEQVERHIFQRWDALLRRLAQ